MELEHKADDGWDRLLSKAGGKPYLGRIKTSWKVVTNRGERVIISLNKGELMSSLICACMVFVVLTVEMFLHRELSHIGVWLYIIPIVWVCIGLSGYRRQLLWRRNGEQVEFAWGFALYRRRISIARGRIWARLERSKEQRKGTNEKVVCLYDTGRPGSCFQLISSAEQAWIMPVFESLREILGPEKCRDETIEHAGRDR